MKPTPSTEFPPTVIPYPLCVTKEDLLYERNLLLLVVMGRGEG